MAWSVVSVPEGGKTGAAMAAVTPHSEDRGLRIDRRGVWYFDGRPFARKEMVCLLASRLRRCEGGGYEVVLPCEPAPLPVEVEDVPFLAVEVFRSGAGESQVLSFRTNIDRIVALDAAHPLFTAPDVETGEPIPYILLEDGVSARISRPVYYELVALGETQMRDGKEVFGLWSSRQFFVLGGID